MKAIQVVVESGIKDTESAVRKALGDRGFGVLTEIDVAATLKEKIDIDRAPMKILGACNPSLAHQALEGDPDSALVLPCNVVLEEMDTGRTTVRAVDPHSLITAEDLKPLADEAAAKLAEALASLT
ncbi:MAG: DUF302 domain-containing protein [Actinobacteria bacterium]|nr:DUF302 domain-containing protein [Actinomycetota bacterium]MCL5446634.1 DUF302 domain-containing protein [Actinomycetota bacterium]